ncbi:MAG TPA: Rrf2 family transcriptional regulator [Pyrinomonadaceae bacterium]|nr:Rrf2 family transcriptional regulator [Pyrinomonadaceae bacterium]
MSTSSRFAVAVHVLTLMAWAGDEPLKSEQIACSVNTNAVVIRRILCQLAKAGLVASQTGAAGGSRLAKPAGEITLREVYRAVEGRDIFALHRQPPNKRCSVGAEIGGVLECVQSAVDEAVNQSLDRITLQEVVRSVKSCTGGGKARLRPRR